MTELIETTSPNLAINISERPAHTLASAVEIEGVGLHTGAEVSMRLTPAEVGSGIQFVRTDLPGQPVVKASFDHVVSTNRCTTIANGPAQVHTVEHLMAALGAYRIDDVIVEISAAEPPVAGGNSVQFVRMIEEAGLVARSSVPVYHLSRPFAWQEGESSIVAIPDACYRVSYMLHYPRVPLLHSQYVSFAIDSETFKRELAPCRSFALFEEVEKLRAAGLIRGTSLESGVVIDGNRVLNEEGLHFEN